MSWFDDLSPTAKKAYIAKHPTSKYAKGARKSGGKRMSGADRIRQASKEMEAKLGKSKPTKAMPKGKTIDPVKLAKLRHGVSGMLDSIKKMQGAVGVLQKQYKR